MVCKKCGQYIDDNADICVICGAKIKSGKTSGQKKPFYKKWWFWLIVVLGVVIISSSSGDKSSEEAGSSQSATADRPEKQTEKGDSTHISVPETSETSPKATVYTSGMYKVGSEIEPGEYFVMAESKYSAYVQVSKDSSGTLESIVSNENVSTFFFVTVSEGQYLTVNRGTFVKAEDAKTPAPDADGNYGEGMYRVGIDIPAGEYKVTPHAEERAYIEVSTDSLGKLDSIVSNQNTEGASYISVEEGQYLKVNRGEFVFVG